MSRREPTSAQWIADFQDFLLQNPIELENLYDKSDADWRELGNRLNRLSGKCADIAGLVYSEKVRTR